MNYLKDYSYYNDLYDLSTIKDCINSYWRLRDGMEKRRGELKDVTDEEFNRDLNKMLNWHLYTVKGERYRNKKKSIDEWMASDKIEQDKYDSTPAPQGILCPKCKTPMKTNMKHLESVIKKPLQVIFLFECPKCNKRRWIMEDKSEWKSTPPKCSKCGKKAKSTVKRKGRIITWTTTCSTCGHKDVDVDDLDKSEKERKEKEDKDKKFLEKYRAEMCFDDKKGQEYIETIEAMQVANVVHDEEMRKYDDPVVEQAFKLKKTKVADIEKKLIKAFEKEKYSKLVFDKPEINEFVIVPFTVEDTDSSRSNRDSLSQLEKIIKDSLYDTNWRLLTGSITYRMGYLQGRLKGYEREGDLIELFGKKKEVKVESKITDEMRQKYAGNNLVQLAKMTGEYEGIENMRKRRLAKEPDGFFLKEVEDYLTCGICGQTRQGKEIWWTEKAIYCADCWKNIQEKVIPQLVDDMKNKVWIKDWQIQSDYGVHPMTAKKLRRLGQLIGRDLKTNDGYIYCTIYLVEENKGFLQTHPKKQSGTNVEFADSKGNKIKL